MSNVGKRSSIPETRGLMLLPSRKVLARYRDKELASLIRRATATIVSRRQISGSVAKRTSAVPLTGRGAQSGDSRIPPSNPQRKEVEPSSKASSSKTTSHTSALPSTDAAKAKGSVRDSSESVKPRSARREVLRARYAEFKLGCASITRKYYVDYVAVDGSPHVLVESTIDALRRNKVETWERYKQSNRTFPLHEGKRVTLSWNKPIPPEFHQLMEGVVETINKQREARMPPLQTNRLPPPVVSAKRAAILAKSQKVYDGSEPLPKAVPDPAPAPVPVPLPPVPVGRLSTPVPAVRKIKQQPPRSKKDILRDRLIAEAQHDDMLRHRADEHVRKHH